MVTAKGSGLGDGMRADIDGNLWVGAGWVGAGYDGVHVIAPGGERIGQILLPEDLRQPVLRRPQAQPPVHGRQPVALRGVREHPRGARRVTPATAGDRGKPAAPASDIESNERLARELTPRQVAMIAIGGAIGTGLFLGSSLAVRLAGPGVIFTYVIGAAISLLMMRALSEMAAAHPTAGSFGVHAEIYASKWLGYTMRYSYWAAQSIANGSECIAAAIYCQWWFPGTPRWAWILALLGGAGVRQRALGGQLRSVRILVLDHQGHGHRNVHRGGRRAAGGRGRTPGYRPLQLHRLRRLSCRTDGPACGWRWCS